MEHPYPSRSAISNSSWCTIQPGGPLRRYPQLSPGRHKEVCRPIHILYLPSLPGDVLVSRRGLVAHAQGFPFRVPPRQQPVLTRARHCVCRQWYFELSQSSWFWRVLIVGVGWLSCSIIIEAILILVILAYTCFCSVSELPYNFGNFDLIDVIILK